MRFLSLIGETKPGPPNQVYIPIDLLNDMHLKPQSMITVRAGAIEVKAQIAALPTRKKGRFGIVAANIYRMLQLPRGYPLIAKIDPFAGIIRLGPILGLFTRRVPSTSQDNNQARFLQLLTLYSRKLRILTYVFTPSDIVWSRKVVTGYIYRESGDLGVWEPHTFPFPQVVYDRIGNRRSENMSDVQKAKQSLLMIKGLQYFNFRYLNKLETHRSLRTIPEVSPYLPETEDFGDGNRLNDFLERYEEVYIKPTNGSLGRGIIKVNKTLEGYQYQYRFRSGRIIKGKVPNWENLKKSLKRLTKNKPYIIQQGLKLKTFNGAPFDIRILMQKNHNGLWRRTKMLARVAKKGSITSNLSTGANPELIADILVKVFGEDPNKPGGIGNYLRKVGDLIPPAMEEAMGIQFGELGLDLGIDVNGKVWLIEVNSKPYKSILALTLVHKLVI